MCLWHALFSFFGGECFGASPPPLICLPLPLFLWMMVAVAGSCFSPSSWHTCCVYVCAAEEEGGGRALLLQAYNSRDGGEEG